MKILSKEKFNKKIIIVLVLFCLCISSVFTAERIVSLSPSGTEIIFALGLGDKLVGRTDFCTFPEEVKKIDSVGGFDGKSFSLENILAFNPDFVYLSNGMHNHLINSLENFGIQVYVSDINSIEDIFKEIISVSKLLNVSEVGLNYVSKMKKELNNLKEDSSDVNIYCEIFNSPFLTCGKNSFINDIIEYAGGKNIFYFLDSTYPQVSEESIIVNNPQIILAPDYSENDLNKIYSRNGWQNIDAIKNKKVFSVSGDIFTRPGPRVLEAVILLKEIINEE
ncbi:MAG: cobalamin-binding protein [Spirochaetaceae bacterium]|nr:cobalamin-binding protein [Spirochaetaceae bacterium]